MNKHLILFVTLFSLLIAGNVFSQGVGINNSTPAASAMLDVTSTSKGVLIPRMTTAQRLAIPAPAEGLLVYETTTDQFFYFDGALWKPISVGGAGWNVTGNAGTAAGTNFIGTTDAVDLITKTNNTERMRVTSGGNVGIGITSPVQKLEVGGLNVAAATSGSSANGITRLQPSGTSAIMDMGVFGGVTHGWIQVRDNASYALNYNLSLNPNGGNVGVGTIVPTAKLSVTKTGIDDILSLSDNLNSLVIGTDTDLPGFIRLRPTSGTGFAITNNGDAVGLFVKADATANVGIGTIAPVEKLHVEGSIRMVDGNQGTGKVMTSDANGKASWQNVLTRYTSVNGSISTSAPSTFGPMSQMTSTFTAKSNIIYVHFSAAGANANACGQRSINFQVLLNGAVVQTTQSSIEDITGSTAKIWDINIEVPISVVPGTTNTVSINWSGNGCTNILNGPTTAVAPHGSYRILTIVEP